jgi:hypothetical protein
MERRALVRPSRAQLESFAPTKWLTLALQLMDQLALPQKLSHHFRCVAM